MGVTGVNVGAAEVSDGCAAGFVFVDGIVVKRQRGGCVVNVGHGRVKVDEI